LEDWRDHKLVDRQSGRWEICPKEHFDESIPVLPTLRAASAQVTNKSKPTTGVVPDRVYATPTSQSLSVIGDIYHGPVLMRDGLITALVRENIPVTFIEDPAELNAKSLSECSLPDHRP